VLGLDLQFRLAHFANPMMLAIDKGVIVNSFTVICGANVALHENPWLRRAGQLLFLVGFDSKNALQ